MELTINDAPNTVIEDAEAGTIQVSSGADAITVSEVGTVGPPGGMGPTGHTGPTGPAGSDSEIRIQALTEINDQDHTVQPTDFLLGFTALSAPRKITIPFTENIRGRALEIKDQSNSAGTYNVSIEPEAGHGTKIEGQDSISLTLNFDGVKIYCNGTHWYIKA